MTAQPYRTSVTIAAPPEVVYAYFTRPEAIVKWMGDYAVLDPTPGGVFRLDINGVPVRGRYLELDPPHRLLISWGHAGSALLPPGTSTVEVTIAATAEGTRVSIEHRGLPPEEAAQHTIGWRHFLARLTVAAPGHDPGPDPFAQTAPGHN
ncbi:MAG TPA: SRPBCC domain-containing protein [Jiangellaceae bacterium]|nr:SRPBCC domain-containing protein [Jiangellaceae bacterium]